MPPFDPPLAPSEISGLFPGIKLLSPLKPGGQGAVFKVVSPPLGTVALKIVGPRYKRRAEREIESLKSIDHPRIIKLLRYGTIRIRGQVCPFIMTPYIEGEDLRERLKTTGPLPEGAVRTIMTDMCGALVELWVRRIVHRDIKPDNILLQSDTHAVLFDLGIAKHLDMSTITIPGGWLGTLGYMSPEQRKGQRPSVKTDVFALGITCFEALIGKHPFNRDQDAIMAVAKPPAASSLASCSVAFSNILSAAMSYSPLDRPVPTAILVSMEAN